MGKTFGGKVHLVRTRGKKAFERTGSVQSKRGNKSIPSKKSQVVGKGGNGEWVSTFGFVWVVRKASISRTHSIIRIPEGKKKGGYVQIPFLGLSGGTCGAPKARGQAPWKRVNEKGEKFEGRYRSREDRSFTNRMESCFLRCPEKSGSYYFHEKVK